MLSARPLAKARPGRRLRLRLTLARVRGATSQRTISVPVPQGLHPGPALLMLRGTAADMSGSGPSTSLIQILTSSSSSSSGSPGLGTDNNPGPLSIAELAQEIASIHRFDGVTARFVALSGSSRAAAAAKRTPKPTGGSSTGLQAYRDGSLRISGTIAVPVVIGR
jgi:hypothetical protein